MGQALAILDVAKRGGIGPRMFGKDVANQQLFRSLVRHGGFASIDFLMREPIPLPDLKRRYGAGKDTAEVRLAGLLDHGAAARAGTLLRGGGDLEELAWFRARATGDGGYSLIGLIHTIAPYAIRQDIANASIAPIHPWDALICTSPTVQEAMLRMFDEQEEYLRDRFAGSRTPRPQLPLIPLGVDGDHLAALADRPDVRAAVRSGMGIGPKDMLILWLGRLSFYEKAFPQPMMMAVEQAVQATGQTVHFAMAGWFPDESHEGFYREAAALHAPSVTFHIVDGRDQAVVGGLWAASDIFLSLVDNIQETFGLTPVEAMAAGKPVVVSDWDGYRYTVEHGVQGFLIPSLIGPAGSLSELGEQHRIGLRSYQAYAGLVAQHSAVHVAEAGRAIAELIRAPELRAQMGEAGRRRVRALFDHRVVAPLYAALARELAAIRAVEGTGLPRRPVRPVKGDPLRDFAGFATDILSPGVRLTPASGASREHLAGARRQELDTFGAALRLPDELTDMLFAALLDRGPIAAGDLVALLPTGQHQRAVLTLLWMAKMGLIDWHPGEPPRG
jgi:glycosyltransferase involved in cell wall biosynthesis